MAKQRKSTKVEKVEVKKEAKAKGEAEEPKKIEAPAAEDPPANACDALMQVWAAGTRGLFDGNSEFCLACMEDFVECATICKAGTKTKEAKVKEKKERKKSGTKVCNKYQHGVGTQADTIDTMLEKGASLEEMTEAVLLQSDKTAKQMMGRVKRHIDHLQTDPAHGFVIGVIDGKYRFLSPEELTNKKERKVGEKKKVTK